MMDEGPDPISGVEALRFDLDMLTASDNYRRWLVQQAGQQVGAEGFGVPLVVELLTRIYMDG